tara:strand:+ start:293 stop:808 length:516 start_codon:yes stop_codon:yes gene_type:complete
VRKSEVKDWTPRDFVEKFKQDILKCPQCEIDNKLFQRLSENPQFEVVSYKRMPGDLIRLFTNRSEVLLDGASWVLTSWWPKGNQAEDWRGYNIGDLEGVKYLYLLYITEDGYLVPIRLEDMTFHTNRIFMDQVSWFHHYRVTPKMGWRKWRGLGSGFINWNTNPLGEDSKE